MDAPEQPLGEVARSDGAWILRFERRLSHPPEKVWRAITESEHLAHWLPADIVGERAAGAAIELPFWPSHVEKYGLDEAPLTGEIRVWDPPKVFEWTWDTDVVRFELEPVDGGTALHFTTWLGPSDEAAANTAAGYHACFDHLIELLDTGDAPPLAEADVSMLELAYGEATRSA